MKTGMTRDDFASLLNSFGANPERWPAAKRAAAMYWFGHPETAAMLAEAQALDAALDHYVLAPVSTDFLERHALPEVAPDAPWRPLFFPVWQRSAVLAACAVTGFLLGLLLQGDQTTPSHVLNLQSMVVGAHNLNEVML